MPSVDPSAETIAERKAGAAHATKICRDFALECAVSFDRSGVPDAALALRTYAEALHAELRRNGYTMDVN